MGRYKKWVQEQVENRFMILVDIKKWVCKIDIEIEIYKYMN